MAFFEVHRHPKKKVRDIPTIKNFRGPYNFSDDFLCKKFRACPFNVTYKALLIFSSNCSKSIFELKVSMTFYFYRDW